jgi:hypothetical protein
MFTKGFYLIILKRSSISIFGFRNKAKMLEQQMLSTPPSDKLSAKYAIRNRISNTLCKESVLLLDGIAHSRSLDKSSCTELNCDVSIKINN